MLRKLGWTVLGIAGLSLLLCGGGCTAEAQAPGAATQQQQPGGSTEDLQGSVAELRAEVAQLRQEVTRLSAQVAEAGEGGSGSGTGGSGSAGTSGAAQGTGRSGSQAPVVSDVPPARSTVPVPRGTAVVNALYTGTVTSVSASRVVIDSGDGAKVPLNVDARTKVLREGRRIEARQLQKGEQVRAVVDMVGQDETLEIDVLPAAAPEE